MSPEPRPGRLLLVAGPATGGIGSHVAGLATGLPALGWSVTVFTSPLTAARFGLGDRVVTGWPAGLVSLLPAVRTLRRLIRGADVVHAHGHQAGLITVLTAATLWPARRPVLVVSWHNAILGAGPRRRLLALAEIVQVRAATLVTGACADLVDRARALGARTARLAAVAAPAAVAVSRADETAGDRLLDSLIPLKRGQEHGPVVLTVSRIAAQKRLDVLVEAAAGLSRRIPGLRWLVAGDGDAVLLAKLERQAAALGAPVTFLGVRKDIPVLMAAADVFALTSDWEARALVVQEAMAAGLTVVATEVGGLPDLLAETDQLEPAGLLVPPGDAAAFTAAVELALTDRDLAAGLARSARERFAGLPTEDDVVQAWSRDYAELIG